MKLKCSYGCVSPEIMDNRQRSTTPEYQGKTGTHFVKEKGKWIHYLCRFTLPIDCPCPGTVKKVESDG